MQNSRGTSSRLLRISEILYGGLIVLSFYLLLVSRTGEARTVWEVLHPLFLPILFAATLLLLLILLTSEKVAYRMTFVIVHSILIHSFFSIVFPAGDLSGQQLILGRTRRVFDNTILHGLTGWPEKTLPELVFGIFAGSNLQAALSTMFARMLSIDIFWVHLFLVPVLWGTFVPIATFLVAKALGAGAKAAILSSLLVSAFPYATYFGAISVPNSLGFIFFYYALSFMLRYLSSSDSRDTYWMIIFVFFSFLSHSLTGIMAFALLLVAVTLKTYKNKEQTTSITARISLLVSLCLSTSLLPISFIYLRFFTPMAPVFSLTQLHELPPAELAGLFLVGELIYGFSLRTIFLIVIGPTLGLLWMMYLLVAKSKAPNSTQPRTAVMFLFAAFMIVVVDYRILKLFMQRLPINEERLWVFRDLIAAPFVGLALHTAFSSAKNALKARISPIISTANLQSTIKSSKALSKNFASRIVHLFLAGLLLAPNLLFPLLLAGWVGTSLSVAYPHVAPLQTTQYELEAVRYIEENTPENYVVICDVWTIYAGGMVVGIYNPHAFYFGELDPRGYDLFTRMSQEPSEAAILEAMNQTGTDTTVAYFIVTEPRLGTERFHDTVTNTLQNEQLELVRIFGDGKLYVFSYRKE